MKNLRWYFQFKYTFFEIYILPCVKIGHGESPFADYFFSVDFCFLFWNIGIDVDNSYKYYPREKK